MIKRIAVVPARGGSKRIPRKNIQDFCGKPMMAHIIETAARSGLFDTIHVSTEDAEISAIARALGYPPEFQRSADLADDDTGLIPVLRHVIERFHEQGKTFDQAWLLMPCAPLLTVEDLRGIDNRFQDAGPSQALVCVVRSYGPIERAYHLRENHEIQPVNPNAQPTRSQDLPESFFDAGVCSVFPTKELCRSKGPVWSMGIIGHQLGRRSAVDIDNEDDWKFAEFLFQATHRDPSTPKS